MLAVLPPAKALVFIAVHEGLFGVYLGCTFAPNHKGMPAPTARLDFLRPQVLTLRDVRGGRLVELGVPYAETGLIDSYRQALRHLYRVGAPLRLDSY